ncbi:MAG: hypothetical protein CMH81_02115 [Nitrospiraceae bacterium]|nr:hypothetical protein [Nitrospiraceae bacterium]|tara:strand:- start:612 stop:803 length:192 start_codon:yes stop_codon:yes gene_type:complete
MNAIRTAYAITLISIVGLIGTFFVNCSTPQTSNPGEIRKHTNESFDRLSAEEQAKKHRSEYGQ